MKLPRSVPIFKPFDDLLSVTILTFWTIISLAWLYQDNIGMVLGELSRGQMFGRDFVNYWCAALLAVNGQFDRIFDTMAFNDAFREIMGKNLSFNAFPYPPHGLWIVLPLAALPYGIGLAVWLVGGFAVFTAAVLLGRSSWRLPMLALLLAPAGLANANTGQNGYLSGALMVGGFRLLERRPMVAGTLFGLLSFKPQLGLLLPFVLVAGRHWRAVAAAAVTATLLVAASLVLVGTDAWRIYLEKGAPAQRDFLEHGRGIYQFMIPSVFMAGRLLGLSTAACYAVQGVATVLTVAGCVWSFLRPTAPQVRTALVMVGTFLMTPYGFNYDMPMVAAAVVMLAVLPDLTRWEAHTLALLWILPTLMVPFGAFGLPIGPVVLGLSFAVLLRRVGRVGKTDAPAPHALPELVAG